VADELEFFEPEDVPRPKEEVHFRSLSAHPYQDGRRVRLKVALTPFQERPNLDFEIVNDAGQPVGTLTVIESMDHAFELTLHIRGPVPAGPHTVRARLYYLEGPPAVETETHFYIPDPANG
jgi:hypothetical protein